MERREALAAYNDAYKEQDDLYRAVARQCGLSDCAFWVLYALRESGRPMTQSDVCAAVYQPKQTVHSALKKLLEELAKTLEAEGIETEIVQAGHTAHSCNACASCKKTFRCVYDDLVNETAPKLAEADALVIGAPVYFASPTGGAIAFMDRLFYSTPHINKTMKVGAAVVSCRRGGNTASFDVLNKYFTITGMPIASSQYWNMVYGNTPEEVRKDGEGLQTMRTLGRNMAFLMKSIQLGREQFGIPEKEPPIVTSFHHE